MKGIIFHTRSFSVHDGPGIRKSIFLKGCPLRCKWCHNPESHLFDFEEVQSLQKLGSKSFNQTKTVGRVVSVEELMRAIRADIPFFEESGGGVTLSGGEPLAQPDFTVELLAACKNEEIHTALDTCGHAPSKDFKHTIEHTDLYLFDLKLANSDAHKQYTGIDNRLILQNLKLASESGKPIIIRIPLVEGITDTSENLEGIKSIVASHRGINRIDILPYHSLAKHKFKMRNKKYSLDDMKNYSQSKAQIVANSFKQLVPIVSVGG
ncbi:MAG TPA: glycyl-radical enzyme activating protein [Perlabentimonas sp.]|nr:glycyl-radical enzyme activating protein [Bacteroidales bacterium]MDD4673584.1 glycyl-radical enzyme activating protein [Bacteroidales bacterium]HZJ73932.1 glycyl-radical enzyme activating protein [Perlabentimonas sp.]